MRKSIALFVAMLFVAFLAGCGGGGDDAAHVGNWKLVSMEQDGVGTDLSQFEGQGITGVLSIGEDNKVSLNLMGESMTGTWEDKGDDGLTVTLSGSTADCTIADNKLTLSQNGSKLIFEKSDGTVPAVSSPATSEPGTSAPATSEPAASSPAAT